MTKGEIQELIITKYDAVLTGFYSSLMNSEHYSETEKNNFNVTRVKRLNEFKDLVNALCKED